MIGGRSHHLAVPLGWRKRASAEGDAEATEVRRAEWAVSEGEPRQHFRRSPPPLCGEWRRDGARGERRQRGIGWAPAADPQPEARAARGQRDLVP